MADQTAHMPTAPYAGSANSRADGEMAPTYMYKLVIGFGVCAFLAISIASFLGVKAVDLPTTAPDLVRDVRVANDGRGTVTLFDADDGSIVATFDAEKRTVVRDLFRRLDLMRVAASKPVSDTYRILSWDRGDMAVTSKDVKFRINIPAGVSAEPFAVLLQGAAVEKEG